MTFRCWWHLNFNDLSGLQHFSFCDISVSLIFQFWWYFGFGDISTLKTFQFWWHAIFGDLSVLVTFQFWGHFRFGGILFWWNFRLGEILFLVTWASSKTRVIWMSAKHSDWPTTNNMIIVSIQIFCWTWRVFDNMDIGNWLNTVEMGQQQKWTEVKMSGTKWKVETSQKQKLLCSAYRCKTKHRIMYGGGGSKEVQNSFLK